MVKQPSTRDPASKKGKVASLKGTPKKAQADRPHRPSKGRRTAHDETPEVQEVQEIQAPVELSDATKVRKKLIDIYFQRNRVRVMGAIQLAGVQPTEDAITDMTTRLWLDEPGERRRRYSEEARLAVDLENFTASINNIQRCETYVPPTYRGDGSESDGFWYPPNEGTS